MSPKGIFPFEFNSRFSGTTSIRAYFGFNEPEMFINNYFLNKEIKKQKIKKGMALRYIEEIFIDNKNYKNIKYNFGRGKINRWF